MMRSSVLVLAVSCLLVVSAHNADSGEAEAEAKGGFTLDVGFGWTATRGNDVQVGNLASLSTTEALDQATLTPLVTTMKSDFTPFVRAAYEGETWGVQGEYWQFETGGSLDGSLSNPEFERGEILEIWDGWLSRLAETTRYTAHNDLSVRSIRSDLTRRLAPGLTLAVGLHLARYENSRAENVESELSFLGEAFPEVLESQSRVEGWLYGPSVGLRGSLALGASSRVGLSIFQSVLFTEVDLEASWTGTSEFPFESNLTIDSTSSSRSAVPVTDVRAALTVSVSRNVSIGAFALLSVWLDLPQAGSFSISRERWEATKSTLVFASVGPVVRVGF